MSQLLFGNSTCIHVEYVFVVLKVLSNYHAKPKRAFIVFEAQVWMYRSGVSFSTVLCFS